MQLKHITISVKIPLTVISNISKSDQNQRDIYSQRKTIDAKQKKDSLSSV